jgi:hypothetical protein
MLADFREDAVPADWREMLADELEGIIRGANGGGWPASVGEWHGTCRRLGLRCLLSKQPLLWRGFSLGRTVVVQGFGAELEVLCRICHEVCEALQLLEEFGPVRAHESYDRHKLARKVERRYRRAVGFVFRACD